MQKQSKGSLTLVGAGPGDPELITLKGLKAIISADVILYDALINPKLLDHNSFAKKIYVGKRRGYICKTQAEINSLIINYALNGLRVIRLKGGDPLVFARAYEELEAANLYDIPVRIIPGITSYTGIAAQHQIPLTKRGKQESFWVVTGHTQSGKISKDLIWAAKSSATVIVLMGVRNLSRIVEVFRRYKAGKFPVAIVQNGTTEAERTLVTDLDHIVKNAIALKFDSPATLIFGPAIIDRVTKFKNQVALNIVTQ